MMELQFNEYLALNDVQVRADKDGIFVPVSVEHKDLGKYHGDARSFGYHFDDGPCSVVTYEQVFGVLADDTVAIVEEYTEIRRSIQKPDIALLDADKTRQVPFDKDNAELLIRYGDDCLFLLGNDFFHLNTKWGSGPVLVTRESACEYRAENKEYQSAVKKYNRLVKQSQENLRELKKFAIASYDS